MELHGAFAVAEGSRGDYYRAPRRGVLRFSAGKKPDEAVSQWRELQKHAGSGACVALSSRWEQHVPQNRLFFPQRNITMSALTEATVIIEAGNTSGTLTQARAAIAQGRKLFILDSCFQRSDLTWPRRFEEQGAIRVREYEQIREVLGRAGEHRPAEPA